MRDERKRDERGRGMRKERDGREMRGRGMRDERDGRGRGMREGER